MAVSRPPGSAVPSSSLWSPSEKESATSANGDADLVVPLLSPREERQAMAPGATGSTGTTGITGITGTTGVKGRHTYQHQDSLQLLPVTLDPEKTNSEKTSSEKDKDSLLGSGAANAPDRIVRVDSKDRWRMAGFHVAQVPTPSSNPPRVHRLVGWLVPNQALLSGLAYCVSSCSMILLNKMVLSGYKWRAQTTLMLYQNLVSVTIVLLLSSLGLIQLEPLTWRLVAVWVPVNVIFVGMLITSFFSLQFLQVAMVTILKNVTNLIIAFGEMYLFHSRHSLRVWGALFLMIVSAICGGITDLSFHPVGYSWQAFNCLFTAAYSLTLRKQMDAAKACTRSGTISEFSMVLLNNALSFPPAIFMILAFGELDFVLKSPLMLDRGFWVACTLSGLLGLAISFTSMWFLHQTSPTTYSLVGSLNKIPLSILGIVLFNAPTSIPNIASILFGCFAGVVFARAKMAG